MHTATLHRFPILIRVPAPISVRRCFRKTYVFVCVDVRQGQVLHDRTWCRICTIWRMLYYGRVLCSLRRYRRDEIFYCGVTRIEGWERGLITRLYGDGSAKFMAIYVYIQSWWCGLCTPMPSVIVWLWLLKNIFITLFSLSQCEGIGNKSVYFAMQASIQRSCTSYTASKQKQSSRREECQGLAGSRQLTGSIKQVQARR